MTWILPERILFRLLPCALLALLFGCGEVAASKTTLSYENEGVSFRLPSNWEVTEDVEVEGFRYLFVETPGEAILTIHLYPADESFDLEGYVASSMDNLTGEMPIGEISIGSNIPIVREVDTVEFAGIQSHFSIEILSIEVPHLVRHFSITQEGFDINISEQVSAEDLHLVEDGFDLVLSSFTFVNPES